MYLLGKTLKELTDIVVNLNMKSYIAKQIAYWIYNNGVKSIDDMTNISKSNRKLLADNF